MTDENAREAVVDPELDEDGREVVDMPIGYELPPLFVKEGTDNHPTNRPIIWCYVWKKDRQTREMGFIDFAPVEDLADIDQLRDRFGPGLFQIQGRGANKKDTIKQVTVSVGGNEQPHAMQFAPAPSRAELDLSKLAAAAIAVATPLLTLWERMAERSEARRAEERANEERRRSEERAREDKRAGDFMQSMTQLMGARMTDLEALLKAQTAAGGVGSTGGKRLAEAYQEGQADTIELIRAIKSEGLGGEDPEVRIIGLVESFFAGKKKADEDEPPPEPNGKA